MNKYTIFISVFIFIFIFIFIFNISQAEESLVRYKEPQTDIDLKSDSAHTNTYIPTYLHQGPDIPLEGLQCPVPHKDRVKNYTGIQCVYSSIEMLGRWAEEPKLTEPPITSRSDCKGFSGPGRASEILNKLGVKFEQTYGDKEKGIKLIKKAMREGRGALWDVPGHAMVLVHYDEVANKVCWVDNSDSSLKIQQTNIEKFKKRWGSWVLTIYADEDTVTEKIYNYNLPIIDAREPFKKFPRGYIPFPQFAF
jgi:hypothetical protein